MSQAFEFLVGHPFGKRSSVVGNTVDIFNSHFRCLLDFHHQSQESIFVSIDFDVLIFQESPRSTFQEHNRVDVTTEYIELQLDGHLEFVTYTLHVNIGAPGFCHWGCQVFLKPTIASYRRLQMFDGPNIIQIKSVWQNKYVQSFIFLEILIGFVLFLLISVWKCWHLSFKQSKNSLDLAHC